MHTHVRRWMGMHGPMQAGAAKQLRLFRCLSPRPVTGDECHSVHCRRSRGQNHGALYAFDSPPSLLMA